MTDVLTAEEMLAKLVSFNTISDRSNLPLIEFAHDYLAGHGVEAMLVPDPTGQKSSLFAQIGPAEAGGVMLSGHTDVVPVEGQDWLTDPFSLAKADGKLFGRGTCDMKGFLAIALSLVPEFKAAHLKRPVQFALTYDEEVGCFAAPPLIVEARKHYPIASAVIVGEPTMMRVVNGHKSICELHTFVRGFEVHSSLMHTGVSAVMTAARLINWIEARGHANRAAAPEISGDTEGAEYTPPWTTLHVGEITGGTAHNITAKDCKFSLDIRCIPSETNADWIAKYRAHCAEIEAEMQKINPDTGIRVHVEGDVPGCRPEVNGFAESLARQLTGDNAQHVVSYATEAGQFQDGGYSTIVCGPGSIEQAHQPNEYLSIDQLQAGVEFQRRLMTHLST